MLAFVFFVCSRGHDDMGCFEGLWRTSDDPSTDTSMDKTGFLPHMMRQWFIPEM